MCFSRTHKSPPAPPHLPRIYTRDIIQGVSLKRRHRQHIYQPDGFLLECEFFLVLIFILLLLFANNGENDIYTSRVDFKTISE